MTKLEEMAKAYILRFRFGSRALIEPDHPAHIEYWNSYSKTDALACMVAALKVLREPNEAMKDAFIEDYQKGDPGERPWDESFKAMIDVVLKDAP